MIQIFTSDQKTYTVRYYRILHIVLIYRKLTNTKFFCLFESNIEQVYYCGDNSNSIFYYYGMIETFSNFTFCK